MVAWPKITSTRSCRPDAGAGGDAGEGGRRSAGRRGDGGPYDRHGAVGGRGEGQGRAGVGELAGRGREGAPAEVELADEYPLGGVSLRPSCLVAAGPRVGQALGPGGYPTPR